MTIEGAA